MAFVCDRCGECCRIHRVPLTHVDLARMRQLGDFDPYLGVEFLDPREIDLEGEPETLILTPSGLRLLVLAHDESGCIHLDPDAGCTIHPTRPASCRTYPFDRPDTPAPAREGTVEIGRVARPQCPETTGYLSVLGTDAPRDPQTLAVARQVDVRDRELAEYAELVQRWNRRQRLRLRLGRRPQSERLFTTYLARAAPSPREVERAASAPCPTLK